MILFCFLVTVWFLAKVIYYGFSNRLRQQIKNQHRKSLWLSLYSFLLLAIVQIGCDNFRNCRAVDISNVETLPLLLSETGLYSDIKNDVITDSALLFTPQYPLWTDGAEKRRWLILPENTKVNTKVEENWDFPVGTKLFKEFTSNGIRVETRMNVRTEQGWIAAAYLWNSDGSDAERQVEGIENASGTLHDVPSARQCLACHGGRENFVLGFSATQLDTTTRATLYTDGVLSEPSTSDVQLPSNVKKGLGVLHANCSHCHNETRNQNALATDCFNPQPEADFDVTLPPNLSSLQDAPAIVTVLDDLLDGEVIERMSMRNRSTTDPSMPPLGTKRIDEEGIKAVQNLIDELIANGQ